MNRVLYALIPVLLFSVYLYGWRVVAVVIIANIAAYFTEFLFVHRKKPGKVSMAVFVTGTLLALTLPPTIPFWMAALGSVIAICFGKMVFGGFGTNIFNPAILGRTFIYVSFPQQMTITWLKPFLPDDFPGGFIHWSGNQAMQTGATLLSHFRSVKVLETSWLNTFLGFESGSIGETSALLLILACVYLIITKTAKWIPMLSTVLSVLFFNLFFFPHQNPIFWLCTGGVLFGAVFMVTDPVSQPKDKVSLWFYGILIGFLTVFIRRFSLFAEGFMFALLLANSFMPIIEYGIKAITSGRGKKHG
jgi:Na+-transporting NADH:ubiquinone oxidoreductase subunit B